MASTLSAGNVELDSGISGGLLLITTVNRLMPGLRQSQLPSNRCRSRWDNAGTMEQSVTQVDDHKTTAAARPVAPLSITSIR